MLRGAKAGTAEQVLAQKLNDVARKNGSDDDMTIVRGLNPPAPRPPAPPAARHTTYTLNADLRLSNLRASTAPLPRLGRVAAGVWVCVVLTVHSPLWPRLPCLPRYLALRSWSR